MPVDGALAQEQWTRFSYCRDRGHLDFLTKADKCDKFFVGKQWEETDLATLREQRRPALTINKVLSTVASIMGEQVQNRAEVLFRPAKDGDPSVAEALTKVWMQIARNNQLEWLRSEMFADGLIRSRGFLDVRLDFSDAMQGEVRVTQPNSKNVVIDPDAEEYDPDSWNDCFATKWMTSQDIAILYNEDDAQYLGENTISYGYDSIEAVRDRFSGAQPLAGFYGAQEPYGVRRNIRVLERQYRRLDKQLHFVDVQTGDMRAVPGDWDRNKIASVLERAGGQLSTMKKLVKRIRWTVTADSVVLHDDWSPYKHFTLVPYFPYFRYGQTVGAVENLIGPQELLNKVSSQELHVVNTTANSGWKLKAGSLRNMTIEELEQKGSMTGLIIELDEVEHAEKISPNQTPTGLDRISYKSEEHMKTISGVSDSMQGFDREDVAAKAIAYKRQQGSLNQTKIMDNLQRTDFLLARNILDLVQEFYTEPRIIHIVGTDPMAEPQQVGVNQPDPVTGEIVNDLTLGEYEIVITSQPYRDTLEDSQFEQAMALKEAGVQIPDAVLIENSRLVRKNDILKQMQGDQDSPEAQQAKQLQQRMQLAQVSTAEAEAQQKGADAQLKIAKAQREMSGSDDPQAEMQLELQKLQHEQAMAEAKLNMERQKMEQEFALKREQMEREFAIKQAAAEQDAEIKRSAAEQDIALKREMHQSDMAFKEQESQQRLEQQRVQALQQEREAAKQPKEST